MYGSNSSHRSMTAILDNLKCLRKFISDISNGSSLSLNLHSLLICIFILRRIDLRTAMISAMFVYNLLELCASYLALAKTITWRERFCLTDCSSSCKWMGSTGNCGIPACLLELMLLLHRRLIFPNYNKLLLCYEIFLTERTWNKQYIWSLITTATSPFNVFFFNFNILS